jgi:hypothetical protein
MTASVSELEDEIAHLRDLPGLRARWRSVFRRKAPDHLLRHLLYRMIAYRLQAEQLGDLDRDTQRFLDQVAAGAPQWRRTPGKGRPPSWRPIPIADQVARSFVLGKSVTTQVVLDRAKGMAVAALTPMSLARQ